jgi:methyl-accepting chemotaxis protein
MAGIAFILALLIVASWQWRAGAAAEEATDSGGHSLQVIIAAELLFASIVDMDSGYRGFLLTGDDAFLEPYLEGRQAADEQIRELEALTADNPPQVERWRLIGAQVDDWHQTVVEPAIALRRAVSSGHASSEDVTRWVTAGEARRRGAVIRATIDDAISVEQRLLAERQEEASDRRSRRWIVQFFGTIVSVGLALVLTLLITNVVAPRTHQVTTKLGADDGTNA